MANDTCKYVELPFGVFFVFADEVPFQDDEFVTDTVHFKSAGHFTTICGLKIFFSDESDETFSEREVIPVSFGIQDEI